MQRAMKKKRDTATLCFSARSKLYRNRNYGGNLCAIPKTAGIANPRKWNLKIAVTAGRHEEELVSDRRANYVEVTMDGLRSSFAQQEWMIVGVFVCKRGSILMEWGQAKGGRARQKRLVFADINSLAFSKT